MSLLHGYLQLDLLTDNSALSKRARMPGGAGRARRWSVCQWTTRVTSRQKPVFQHRTNIHTKRVNSPRVPHSLTSLERSLSGSEPGELCAQVVSESGASPVHYGSLSMRGTQITTAYYLPKQNMLPRKTLTTKSPLFAARSITLPVCHMPWVL